MVDLSPEFVQALELWYVTFCCEAGGDYQKPGFGNASIRCCNGPLARVLVELGTNHNRLEGAVLTQVQDLVNVVEVLLKFLVVGIVCAPGRVLPDLGNRKLVDWDFRVHAGTWIDTPTPETVISRHDDQKTGLRTTRSRQSFCQPRRVRHCSLHYAVRGEGRRHRSQLPQSGRPSQGRRHMGRWCLFDESIHEALD